MNGTNPTFQNVQAIQTCGTMAVVVQQDPDSPGTYRVVLESKGRSPQTVVLREGYAAQPDAEQYAATVRPVMSDFALIVADRAKATCLSVVQAMQTAQAQNPGNLIARIIQAIQSAF